MAWDMIDSYGGDLSQNLAPDDLWTLVQPLMPSFMLCQQGGGPAPLDERAVLTSVVYVLTGTCRHPPPAAFVRRRAGGGGGSPVRGKGEGRPMAALAPSRSG
ncbi:hypothetical protein ACIQ9P_09850 [Kitasatospora sp. NPDC094019]|uniref:hypothetical protein n=1 Tax=Kitasatospora sp. NPDC094019 TaxID=3364091 RepID=UPI003818E774